MFNELLKAAFPVIEKASPLIAGALGSPLAGIGAQFAMSLLSSKFGIAPNNVSDLAHTISTDPHAEDKLSDLEDIFKHWFYNLTPKPFVWPMPTSIDLNLHVVWDKNNAINDSTIHSS